MVASRNPRPQERAVTEHTTGKPPSAIRGATAAGYRRRS